MFSQICGIVGRGKTQYADAKIISEYEFDNDTTTTMHSLFKWETEINWNKIIGNMHRRFFIVSLIRCSQFMTETQLENLRLIYLHFSIISRSFQQIFFSLCRKFFVFRNQSNSRNLFPVNSLNNLHRTGGRLTSRQRFFCGLWHGSFLCVALSNDSFRS